MDTRSGRDQAIQGQYYPVVEVSAARTLERHERNVLATIPLADANSYTITLPPVGEVEDGARFLIRGVRAAGSYVDGEVDVLAAGDEDRTTTIVADGMTASTDLVLVECVMSRYWRQLQDITT